MTSTIKLCPVDFKYNTFRVRRARKEIQEHLVNATYR